MSLIHTKPIANLLRLGLVASVALIAGAAAADVTGVLTKTTGQMKVKGAFNQKFSSNSNIDVFAGGLSLTGGGIQSTSKLNLGLIEFQNGVISGGPGGSSSAFTEVEVTYKNTSNKPVQAILDSTLLPAGLGFLVSDITTDTGPAVCGNAQLNECGQSIKSNVSFANVSNATTGFYFDVLSNGVSIYNLAGSMTIDAFGNVTDTLSVPGQYGSARSELKNFGLQTIPGSGTSIAYNWDSTVKSIVVPGMLAPGASAVLTYRVSTYATTSGNCARGANRYNGTCAVGFAVFGDPVGRGGSINGNISNLSQSLSNTGIPVSSIAFNTLNPLLAPTFDSNTGKLGVFLPAPEERPAVPEPASWAMMITGFGLVGASLRRRRSAFA